MNNELMRKSYARFYVADEERIPEVLDIIRNFDEYEFDYYFPKSESLVAVWDGKVKLVYTHKFEINLHKLQIECWKRGIYMFVINQQEEFYYDK